LWPGDGGKKGQGLQVERRGGGYSERDAVRGGSGYGLSCGRQETLRGGLTEIVEVDLKKCLQAMA